jgi:hypothetical protein
VAAAHREQHSMACHQRSGRLQVGRGIAVLVELQLRAGDRQVHDLQRFAGAGTPARTHVFGALVRALLGPAGVDADEQERRA